MSHRYDVVIIGAGFAGSLLARILCLHGRSVALVDAQRHPRFAIGESSTPIADLLLRRLGEQHGLSDMESLSTYGSWKRDLPEVACGLKRGFSYYAHTAGEPFADDPGNGRSLMVAASASDIVADTQWYRSEVDAHLFEQAVQAGAADWCGYRVDIEASRDGGRLSLAEMESGETRTIDAEWLIDASGPSSVLAHLARSTSLVSQLRTNTRSVFAHFEGVRRWRESLEGTGFDLRRDPFDTDAAAQHHLVDRGWFWMLRFDNGITSVGMTTPERDPRLDWSQYPSLCELMGRARIVTPASIPVSTGRLQRFFDPVVDSRRMMLPTASVAIDPLHSTGIAHAIAGVDRISRIVLQSDAPRREQSVAEYRRAVMAEARLLDRLVHTAYATMNDFPRFVATCMLYFAGAIRCEERYLKGDRPEQLWNADDPEFVSMVDQACDRLTRERSTEQAIDWVRTSIQPWNTAGLMSPFSDNRYAYTATKV